MIICVSAKRINIVVREIEPGDKSPSYFAGYSGNEDVLLVHLGNDSLILATISFLKFKNSVEIDVRFSVAAFVKSCGISPDLKFQSPALY